LSLPKGKNQGPGKLPRISQALMLTCGRLSCARPHAVSFHEMCFGCWGKGLSATSAHMFMDFIVFLRKEDGPIQRTIYC
jgi:hypothetical protein